MLNKINKRNQIYRIAAFIPFVLATTGLLDFIKNFRFLQDNITDGLILGFLAYSIVIHFIGRPLKKNLSFDFLAIFYLFIKMLLLLFHFLRGNITEFSWHYVLIVLFSFFIYLPTIINHIRYWDYYTE